MRESFTMAVMSGHDRRNTHQLGFLKDMVEMTDQQVPLKQANRALREEFLAHLGDGPFLGGMMEPSLADLSAYPHFVTPYLGGFRGAEEILEYPEIVSWLQRVRGYLNDTPPLMPAVAVKREFPGDQKNVGYVVVNAKGNFS